MTEMEKMTEIYENYMSNYNKCWTRKFTPKLYDKYAKPTISIVNFAKTDAAYPSFLEKLKGGKIKNVKDLYKAVNNLSDFYVIFCRTTYAATLSSEEEEDLKRFFIGMIGEFFFVTFLTKIPDIHDSRGRGRHFALDKVCLPPLTYKDRGIDALCVISNLSAGGESHSAAIQFKFWSPFSKEELTLSDHAQKLMAEATKRDCKFVNGDNDDVLGFVWTGTQKRISKTFLKDELYKQSFFIDMSSFDISINDKYTYFWTNTLVDKFGEIMNF